MYAGTYGNRRLPDGWLFCDGQSLDASANHQYTNLYNAIGFHYGGTGITNFDLPNLTQNMPIGSTSQNDRYINYQGSNTINDGNKTINSDQMAIHSHSFQSHKHSYTYYNIVQNINNANNTFASNEANTNYFFSVNSNNINTNDNTNDPNNSSGNAGNGADYLPPFTTVSFIIFYGYY
jgi:microcystin-dependent protein